MPSSLGGKIRDLRKLRGFSLDQLADLTGSSKSYIWELENKDNPKPSAEKLGKIAKHLKVTTQFLTNDAITEPDPSEQDAAFFQRYRSLPLQTKRKLDDILKILEEGDS